MFYLKPDLELYRQCANPRCQKYFLVKTTSTRTKFVVQNAAIASHKTDIARKKENLANKINLCYAVLIYCVTQVRFNFLYFHMVLFLQLPLIMYFLD